MKTQYTSQRQKRRTSNVKCPTSLVAVDTGGTFTDFYFVTDGRVRTHKVLSTPKDPSRAILRGLKDLGFEHGDLIHGSTVATNALLEHKGARIALVTTAGFEDVIEIGRQTRTELYNIFTERAEPLVSKRDRFGIIERLDADGNVLQKIKKTDLNKLMRALRGTHVEAIAICLLNAYANDSHEQMIAAKLKKLGKPLSLSSHICPEFREYERSSTTCVNAYVTPIMSRYLRRLQSQITQPIRIMQSNGGSLTIAEAAEESIRTLLSGPAGGALGSLEACRSSGYDKLLALDMGGTSADLTLIDRSLELTSEAVLGGYPIKTPMIRIHTIGAGGGSIARVDAGGALQVGPESAGAEPGPICYGQGGTQCTITDAHLYLGRIHAEHFLGGTMTLQPQQVPRAINKLAHQLKLSPEATADGIIQVANANMARALRVISLERGYDSREFSLVAFGGAGGLHACELAMALDIPRVIVPAHPGILSAFGMASADWVRDYVHTILLSEAKATAARLNRKLARLKKQARNDAKNAGHKISQVHFRAEVDVRYQGQSYELRVPLTQRFKSAFTQQHRRQFGYTHQRSIEVVNVRLQARVIQRRGAISTLRSGATAEDGHRAPGKGRNKLRPYKTKPVTRSKLYWQNKSWGIDYCQRDQLTSGDKLKGPVVIAEYSATTFVPPGWQLVCDTFGNLIITIK